VFEKRVLRRIFGSKWWEAGENYMRSFISYTLHHILLWWTSQVGWDRRGM